MSKFKPGNTLPTPPDQQRKPARSVLPNPSTSVLLTQTPQADPQPVVEEDPAPAGALKMALTVTLIFMFFRFSFLHEILTAKLGIDLHILMIFGGLAIFTTLLSGGLFAGVTNKIFIAWLGFAACMLFATIFSVWRGGSFAVFYPYLRTTLILVVLIPAVANSAKSLVQVLNVIGIAGISAIILGLTNNDFRSGRLELSESSASVSNSNDYAAIIMLLMPAVAFFTMRRGTHFLMKIVGCGALSLGCFLVLSTGSRGALISMGLSLLYLLKIGSGKIRAAILLGLPVAALIAVPLLPPDAAARLSTLFQSHDVQTEADASQAERTELLVESLKISLQHPLLGVGPGTFQEYQAEQAALKGQRGIWHETHNSYTQISSECGIPAFLFYVSAIVMTLVVFIRGRKSPNPDIRELTSVLSLMLVSFSVCMFFLAQAYGFGFPVLGGLAIAVNRVMNRSQRAIVSTL